MSDSVSPPINFSSDHDQRQRLQLRGGSTQPVQGGPKDIDDTKSLIEKLDIPSSEETGIIIKVYLLQYLDPQFVVTMVNQAFAKTSSRTPEDTIRAARTPPTTLELESIRRRPDRCNVKIQFNDLIFLFYSSCRNIFPSPES